LLRAGTPESFNVLVKEMQGLGLDIRPEHVTDDLFDLTHV